MKIKTVLLLALLGLLYLSSIGFVRANDTTISKTYFDSISKSAKVYKGKYDSICSTPISKPEPALQQDVNNNVVAALKETVSYINYLFIIIFIITSFTINLFISADSLFSSINFMQKWKSGWIFIWGLFLIGLFIYLFDYKDKLEVFGIFLSLFIAMSLYKVVGLDKLMSVVLNKFGLKLQN